MKHLTPRQSGIAACILDAMLPDQIAAAMDMPESDVRSEIHGLKRTIGARDWIELEARLANRAVMDEL